MTLDLNLLLRTAGHDPARTMVFRHRPSEPKLAKVLPWLADSHEDLFNAYQQVHSPRVEAALLTVDLVAAFVGMAPGTATFEGLYAIADNREITHAEYWSLPENERLAEKGMERFAFDPARPTLRRFDLQRSDFHADWKGKLQISWPPPERSWWRRAHRGVMPVLAIAEESAFSAKLDPWNELTLTWQQLQVMPTRLQDRLAQWRGIYLIHDTSDGRCYVGSAGGGDNILGRWKTYATTGHGDNRRLRDRDPNNLSFSILQLTAPDLPLGALVAIESSWKNRLHTRGPFGLNDN